MTGHVLVALRFRRVHHGLHVSQALSVQFLAMLLPFLQCKMNEKRQDAQEEFIKVESRKLNLSYRFNDKNVLLLIRHSSALTRPLSLSKRRADAI